MNAVPEDSSDEGVLDLCGRPRRRAASMLTTCSRRGCTAVASRIPDDLSYALDQHAWVCTAGHRTADRTRPTARADGADALSGFQHEVDRVLALSREARLSAAIVSMADGMTTGFDLVDLLHSVVDVGVEVLGADAARVLLADAEGRLHLIASSSEEAAVVEPSMIGVGVGPCRESRSTGTALTLDDVADHRSPAFTAIAVEHGFRSAHVAPVRLGDEVVGCLLLLADRPDGLAPAQAADARALCTVAALGVLHERLARGSRPVSEQLQDAFESRVRIEQAKGVLSQRDGISMADALAVLRASARSTRTPVHEVAREVLEEIVEVRSRN